jgi:hypothetical protein
MARGRYAKRPDHRKKETKANKAKQLVDEGEQSVREGKQPVPNNRQRADSVTDRPYRAPPKRPRRPSVPQEPLGGEDDPDQFEKLVLKSRPLHFRFHGPWPIHDDKTLLTIEEFNERVLSIHEYAEKKKGQKEWESLHPEHWLPIIDEYRKAAFRVAWRESVAMEKADMTYWSALFPDAAANTLSLFKPRAGDWHRCSMKRLLVD